MYGSKQPVDALFLPATHRITPRGIRTIQQRLAASNTTTHYRSDWRQYLSDLSDLSDSRHTNCRPRMRSSVASATTHYRSGWRQYLSDLSDLSYLSDSRHTNCRPRYAAVKAQPPAGGQYCVQLASFGKPIPEEVYFCTRSGFVSLRRDKPKGRCSQGANFRRRAILRGKVAFCKVNKRGSIPLYVTERFAAVKARDFPQDCPPYITMMPKTKANKATVSTIPQMVR